MKDSLPIKVECVQIKLTRGKSSKIDLEDFGKINKYKWYLSNEGYAVRSVIGKTIWMHRFVIGAKKGEEVDHINHNKLDNRKKNLRIVSHSKNLLNMKKPIDNTSGAKGVSWKKSRKKKLYQICIGGHCFYLGLFSDKSLAIKAYKNASNLILSPCQTH